ncbi:MAG: GspE/PulE family protein, partial [Pseudomonadota bacterium]
MPHAPIAAETPASDPFDAPPASRRAEAGAPPPAGPPPSRLWADPAAATASLAARLETVGHLSPANRLRAERVADETGERLDRVLTRLGLVGERDLADAMAALAGLPRAERPVPDPELPAFAALGRRFLAEARILPLAETGTTLTLAVADPLDGALIAPVGLKTGRALRLAVALPSEIETALERVAEQAETPPGDTLAADADTAADVARLRDAASEAPVIRLVNQMIRRAVEARASDIHLEPDDRALSVRFRVDGALIEAEAPPPSLRAAVISRLKIMARLNIAEQRLPQDGRLQVVIAGREIDMRVATVPTLHGEGVVLRLLDRSGLVLDLEGLGFDRGLRQAFGALVEKPNGIVLVTGPTGSGKTTTLYAALSQINDRSRKIITIEDPVEYQLPGITQIQVKAGIGLTFAHGLRSILRQDPDVIMIGEIRDRETAEIAVQAALTGHLVLATLHTNSAAAAIDRLRDMGVEDYLVGATLMGALAQRLVRRLCPHCAAPEEPALVARLAPGRDPAGFRRATGCPECRA